MAVITRGQQQKQLLPGLHKIWGDTYKQYPLQWPEIFERQTSKRSFEEEQKISLFGLAAVKNEGSAVTFDSAQEAFTARYTHITYALGFAITEEAIEDNLYIPLAGRYTKALSRSMVHTPEIVAALMALACTTCAAVSGVPVRSANCRSAPCIEAPERLALVRLAPRRLAPSRAAPLRSA